MNQLNLSSNQISDVEPLAGVTNLTQLNLTNNQISDAKPLSGLIYLRCLRLDRNRISKNYCPLVPKLVTADIYRHTTREKKYLRSPCDCSQDSVVCETDTI